MKRRSYGVQGLLLGAMLILMGAAPVLANTYHVSLSPGQTGPGGQAIIPVTISWDGSTDFSFGMRIRVSQGRVAGTSSTQYFYPGLPPTDLLYFSNGRTANLSVFPDGGKSKFKPGDVEVVVEIVGYNDQLQSIITTSLQQFSGLATRLRR
jgi:hypothetical protein